METLKQINAKSDFKLIEAAAQGEEYLFDAPFVFRYTAGCGSGKSYIAKHCNGEYVNCKPAGDGRLLVSFDNHGLGCGKLMCERTFYLTDADFADGICSLTDKRQTGVRLTTGATGGTGIEVQLPPYYQQGPQGEPMTWEKMTDEQKQELADKSAQDVVSIYGSKIQPSEVQVDLHSILGKDCYQAWRFDDDYLYVVHDNGVSKLDNLFNLISTVVVKNYNNNSNRPHLAKIGNKLFIAVQKTTNILYMFDEETNTGQYLENPAGLEYYGAVYAIGGKLYWFQNYRSTDIYVYDAQGAFLQHIENPYGEAKYSGGTVFTVDFHKFDTETGAFEQDAIPFPSEPNGELSWVFSNSNMVVQNSYGFDISDNANTQDYLFNQIAQSTFITAAKNKNKTGTLICCSNGIYVFYYPYAVGNPVARQYTLQTFNAAMISCSEYGGNLYCTTKNNILLIKNIKYLGYDTD